MAIRKSQIIITALGAASLLGSYFSLDAWSMHTNYSSAHWVDPNPVTQWERFWMTIPAGYLALTGLVLLFVALFRLLANLKSF